MTTARPQPTTASFRSCLDTLNTFTAPGALRKYQSNILETGFFSYMSIQPNGHYVLPGNAIFYHFNASVPFVLIAASLKDGFPLLCMVTSGAVTWAGTQERLDLIPIARQLLRTGPEQVVDLEMMPRAIIGDPNFAHFIWNEFPAVHEAAKHHTDFGINLRFDPLGVMSQFGTEHRIPLSSMITPTQGKGWSNTPSVLLGSNRCNASAKSDLLRLMDLSSLWKSAGKIWLTVREKGRTMENQTAFLSALITAQAARDPASVFLLDGFSLPMDFERPIYDQLRSKFTDRAKATQAIIRTIISNHPQAHIQDLTGLPLRNALLEIATCSFYVSHAGTLQHKLGWFFPAHGLQHGNQTSLSPAALRWSAQMISGALEPWGLDPGCVKDTQVRGALAPNARNRDYFVTDIPRAVDQTLAYLDTSIAKQQEEYTPLP